MYSYPPRFHSGGPPRAPLSLPCRPPGYWPISCDYLTYRLISRTHIISLEKSHSSRAAGANRSYSKWALNYCAEIKYSLSQSTESSCPTSRYWLYGQCAKGILEIEFLQSFRDANKLLHVLIVLILGTAMMLDTTEKTLTESLSSHFSFHKCLYFSCLLIHLL